MSKEAFKLAREAVEIAGRAIETGQDDVALEALDVASSTLADAGPPKSEAVRLREELEEIAERAGVEI